MLISSSSLSDFKKSLTEKVLFGNKPTPELIAILLVYLIQGVYGLARLATSFFLKDELALSPAEVSAMMGIAALPWIVKPLFGFMSDGFPIFGYRRRSYLILSGLVGVVGWLSLATVVDSYWEATLALAIASLSAAVSDVIVDSLVVERARTESVSDAGSLQSLCWAAVAFGSLMTAYLSGFLLQYFSNTTIFAITAIFPAIVSVITLAIPESPVRDRPNLSGVKNQIQLLWQAIRQKAIWMPTAFIFTLLATPTADSAFFFFTTNELGFAPEFLGRVRLITSVASLVGVWLFQKYLKTISFRTIFGWTTVISTILGLTALLLVTHTNRALGIDDYWFSMGDSLILTVVGQISWMPIMVLSARLCPPGVEATLFALLMSTINFAGLLSHELGAILTHWLKVTESNFEHLWLLVLITNLSNLLPLLFLGWLPAADPQTEIQPDAAQPIPALEFDSSAAKHLGQGFLPDIVPEYLPQSLPREPVQEKS